MEVGVAGQADGAATTRLLYRQLVVPSLNESLKENSYTVTKITKTVGEFCSKIATVKEQAASQIASLVDAYRKKTLEIKKRPECQSQTLLTAWDQILLEVENEGKELAELAHCLQKTVAIPLYQTANKEKLLIKKTFGCRELSQHTALKAEESLAKKYKDYSESWYKCSSHSKENIKDRHLAQYHNCHNSYVLQLSSVNSINESLYTAIVPELIDDLQESHKNLATALVSHMQSFANIQREGLTKLIAHMDNVVTACKAIDHLTDINCFVRTFEKDIDPKPPSKHFVLPKVAKELKDDAKGQTYLDPSLVVDDKTEPVLKRRCAYTRKQISSLENQIATQSPPTIEKQQDPPTTPTQPGETMEEVLLRKKHEIRAVKCRLQMHHAQHELFTPSVLERLGPVTEEYADDLEDVVASEEAADLQGSRAATATSVRSDKEKPHRFVDQNFMKPALCYYCKGIIVGLLKQGCRCQWCKMCVHKKCRANVPFCTGSSLASKPGPMMQHDDSMSPNYESVDSLDGDMSVVKKADPSLSRSHDDEWDSEDDYDMPFEEGKVPPVPVIITPSSRPSNLPPPPIPSPQANSTPPTAAKPPLPRRPPELFKGSKEQATLCVALFDFDAAQPVDLSLKAGERIDIINSDDVDWWEGKINDRQGYFPASYVQAIQPDEQILRCIYDFGAEDGDEMSLEQGQIVIEVENEGNGWIVGRIQDKKGAFPASYVEVIEPS